MAENMSIINENIDSLINITNLKIYLYSEFPIIYFDEES